ncbi:MAG: phosphate ABC transporter permease PstA [Myxococcota bacterium]|nr:phosphate ABC transporter permease PstA [Myxococcales bacterium]
MTDDVHRTAEAAARLKRRYAADRRFRAYGLAAIGVAVGALVLLLGTIAHDGAGAFLDWEVALDVAYDPDALGVPAGGSTEELGRGDFAALVKRALRAEFPDVTARSERRELDSLVSSGAAFVLRDRLLADPSRLGRVERVWLPLDDEAQLVLDGHVDRDAAEAERRVSDRQLAWLDALRDRGRLEHGLDTFFLTNGDSREPELAGVWGALVGSLWTIAATLFLCFPVGVAAAVYLEEFAPRNRFTDFVEVNINNLAAVPSIVFGLLGLAVLLNFLGLPRSAPLVGGTVLALMTLPTVIIASRSALAAVPPSIREAALGVGASPLQVVAHHVLPLAMPGILTGTIIGMARALGETAPLLMIGMVAFIADVPDGPASPSTVLPVQIYLWADSPERAFLERTSGAILVLLMFLVSMNLTAVVLRSRFERRW